LQAGSDEKLRGNLADGAKPVFLKIEPGLFMTRPAATPSGCASATFCSLAHPHLPVLN